MYLRCTFTDTLQSSMNISGGLAIPLHQIFTNASADALFLSDQQPYSTTEYHLKHSPILTISPPYGRLAIKVLHEGVASVRNVTSQHTDRPVWLVLNCETHVWFKMPVLPVFLRTIHGSLSLYLCNVSTDTFQLYLLFYGGKMYGLESDVLF